MLHFQQDYLGCVDDEANIVKKCDARRQVTSVNIFVSLSRWLDKLMSIMMTMTAAVYVISVRVRDQCSSSRTPCATMHVTSGKG